MKVAEVSVIIIGGGASGLAAAASLTQKGCKVTLIEASSRLGGRLLTHFYGTQRYPIELGAEFVHGEASTTRKYLKQVKQLKQSFYYFDNRGVEPLDEFSKILKKGFAKIDKSEPDFAVSRILPTVSKDPKERNSFAAFVEGFFAADPEQLSKLSVADAEGSDFTSNSQVRSGYSSLVEVLRQQIDLRHYTEVLSSPVHAIEWGKSFVKVRGDKTSWDADAVVITLPIEGFKKLKFQPALPAKQKAAEFISGGIVVKPIVTFNEPLWRLGDEDHQQIVSPSLNFATRWVWKEAPKFQLTSWAGGKKAENLMNEPVDVLLDLVLKDLQVLTGREPSDLKKLVDGIYYHSWINDTWIKGAYSYVKVGGRDARKTLAQPVEQSLFFAGEATATDGSDGTVEGALNQGLRAADELLSAHRDVFTGFTFCRSSKDLL